MEKSSYSSDDDPITSPVSDFLGVKPKNITKKENQFMVLLYTERLEPDD